MSTPNKIRWRESDIEKLNKVVKNFNSKLNRVKAKDFSKAEFLPEKQSVRELRKTIRTRSDYNKLLSSLKRFSKRGAEELVANKKGTVATKYEIRETAIATRNYNLALTKKKQKLKPSKRQIEKQNLKPKKFVFEKLKPLGFDKFKENIKKMSFQSRRIEDIEKYKENYIQGISNQFGSEGKAIIDLIKGIEEEKFFEISISNPDLSIEFIYDKAQDIQTIIKTKVQQWQKSM